MPNFFTSVLIFLFLFSFTQALNQNSQSIQSQCCSHGFFTPKAREFQEFFFRSQRLFDSQEQITEEDFKNIQKLGFSGLWLALKGVPMDNPQGLVPIWNYEEGSSATVDQFFWNEIHLSLSRIAPEWTLARVLEYLLEVKCVNQLTREEFYQYYIVLGFLKGPESLELLNKMKTFLELLKFPDTFVLSNFTLELLAKSIQITSEAIIIDLKTDFGSFLKYSINGLIEKPLRSLAEGRNGFKSGILKKVVIHNCTFGFHLSDLILKILSKNANSLDHLELICFDFRSNYEFLDRIRFSQLTTLRIHLDLRDSSELFDYFQFSAHFNYKVLDVMNNRQFFLKANNQYDYFKLAPFDAEDSYWGDFLRLNSNLTCAFFRNYSSISRIGNDFSLQDMFRPLEKLENFFIFFHFGMNFNFSEPLSLKTLFIRHIDGKLDWSFLDQFTNLEYLNYSGGICDSKLFIRQIQKSKIKRLTLDLLYNFSELEFFENLGNCRSLHNLTFAPNLFFTPRFKKVDYFKFTCFFIKDIMKFIDDFPIMQSVKFLFSNSFAYVNSKSMKKLTGIFPNLETIYFEEGVFSDEFYPPFEVIQSKESLIRDYFNELGCLWIEQVDYSAYYWSLE